MKRPLATIPRRGVPPTPAAAGPPPPRLAEILPPLHTLGGALRSGSLAARDRRHTNSGVEVRKAPSHLLRAGRKHFLHEESGSEVERQYPFSAYVTWRGLTHENTKPASKSAAMAGSATVVPSMPTTDETKRSSQARRARSWLSPFHADAGSGGASKASCGARKALIRWAVCPLGGTDHADSAATNVSASTAA